MSDMSLEISYLKIITNQNPKTIYPELYRYLKITNFPLPLIQPALSRYHWKEQYTAFECVMAIPKSQQVTALVWLKTTPVSNYTLVVPPSQVQTFQSMVNPQQYNQQSRVYEKFDYDLGVSFCRLISKD